MVNIMQEKMSGNFWARCVMHICSWKGPSTTQKSCWDKISFECGQIFYLFFCACHVVFKVKSIWKAWLYLQQAKVLISYCRGNPGRVFSICSDTKSLHCWKLYGNSLSKPGFQGDLVLCISRILFERGENLCWKKLFAYCQTLNPGESWNSEVHRSLGF